MTRNCLLGYIVAALILFCVGSAAIAVEKEQSADEVTQSVKLCQSKFAKESQIPLRSICVQKAYKSGGVWSTLKENKQCLPQGTTILTVKGCETAREELSKFAPQVDTKSSTPATSDLLNATKAGDQGVNVATTTIGTASSSVLALPSTVESPAAVKQSNGLWSSGTFIALVITVLALVIAIGIIFYLLVRHRNEVDEFELAADAQNKRLQSDIDKLKEKLSATQANFEQSQALRKSELAAQRIVSRSTEDDRLPYTRQEVQAPELQAPNNLALSSKLDFEEALSAAFRVLISRNAPLPSGREFERLLANVDDKQVVKALEERGLRSYRLLDSSGATNNLNPTLFALQGNADEWLIYPMPFAERTGMYRRWFDGFDDSKSMAAIRPAHGIDRGGAIELTSKGQLA